MDFRFFYPKAKFSKLQNLHSGKSIWRIFEHQIWEQSWQYF